MNLSQLADLRKRTLDEFAKASGSRGSILCGMERDIFGHHAEILVHRPTRDQYLLGDRAIA